MLESDRQITTTALLVPASLTVSHLGATPWSAHDFQRRRTMKSMKMMLELEVPPYPPGLHPLPKEAEPLDGLHSQHHGRKHVRSGMVKRDIRCGIVPSVLNPSIAPLLPCLAHQVAFTCIRRSPARMCRSGSCKLITRGPWQLGECLTQPCPTVVYGSDPRMSLVGSRHTLSEPMTARHAVMNSG